MDSELQAIGCGLASAASWGAGDFWGGLAAKRGSVYSVVLVSQLLGGSLLMALALLLGEAIPPWSDMILGGIGGACGGVGVLALYSGLARHRMGVVAPVAAVVNAVLPSLVGMVREGFPRPLQLSGFALALVAVWFLTRGTSEAPVRLRDLGLPLVAGTGFGLFYISVDQVSESAVFWPLVSARVASIALIALFAGLRRQRLVPVRGQGLLIMGIGILDASGNAFFALATRLGRLDVASMVSSLYPAGTVLLAWAFLREKLGQEQWLGLAFALAALVLITAPA